MRGRGLMLVAGMKMGQAQAAKAGELKQQGASEAKAQIEKEKTATPSTDDIIAQVEKLSALHKAGALSDEEFAAAKKKILG